MLRFSLPAAASTKRCLNVVSAYKPKKFIMPIKLFQQRLTEAGASLISASGPVQLARALRQYSDTVLFLEDHHWLQAAAALLPDGFSHNLFFVSDTVSPAPAADITAVTIGLGAVPETGSVLVGSSSPQAFRLSLCPRRHIVVIPADQAGLTMSEALVATAQEPSGLVTWVTGPSRTADIEKVLVLGAQGASELIVIIYTEA
jgi:L-lactate dehydrogenase complex protein LldG